MKHQNLINILIFGPLVLAPLLAVEFPRILAYLPVISALLGAPALILAGHQKLRWPTGPAIFLAVVVVLACASVLWAGAPDESGERAGKLAIMLPFYYLFIAVFRTAAPHLKTDHLKLMLAACSLGALVVCFDIWTNLSLHRWIRDLEPGAVTDAVMNRGAVTIVMMSLIPLLYFFKDNKVYTAIAAVPILLMTTQIESQTAQLALAFAIAFYLFFPARQNWLWVLGFFAFAVCLLGMPFAATWLYHNMAVELNKVPLLENAFIGARLEIWDYIGRYAMQSPLLGHGIEITRTVEDFDSGQVFNIGYTTILHPHSFIMQIWIEFGLLGILLCIAAFGAVLKAIHSITDEQYRRISLTMFLTSLLIASFSYGIWQSWFLGMFCLVGGVLLAVSSRQPAGYSAAAQTGTAP